MELISNGGYIGHISDTLDALLLTRNIKYFAGVLIDVRKTLDNILVLSKDNELRKSTLSNKKISNSNYNDIKNIKYPSHIYKYFIPTLQDFLNKYRSEKKIFIRMYDVNNLYYDLLYDILKKYPYNYYYITDDDNLLKKHSLCQIGKICYNYLFLDNVDDFDQKEDIYIITKKYPYIYKNNILSDNFFK